MTSNGFRTKLNEAGVDVYNQTAYWTSTPYVDDEEKENYRYYMHVDKHDNGFINNFKVTSMSGITFFYIIFSPFNKFVFCKQIIFH